ncbi:MAG: PorT family protein [Muribaculaceae bacterium]|nr:PorT family protein [Muribaculaceae bacterium]
MTRHRDNIFWLFLIAILPILASAQTRYDGNLAVGAKSGITLSKLQFNPSVPQSMLMGVAIGGSLRYLEEKNFGLIVELNLEQRGWKEKFEGYNYAYDRKLTYLQMPLLTHVYFGNNRMHGFFNAGPEIGYMVAESTHANFDYHNIEAIEDFPGANRNTDQMTLSVKNKFDYGISAGLGAEFFTGKRHSFNLEGRVYYGLHDVFGNHKKDTFSGSSALSVMLTVGYYYQLK